jgi:hypothetical protein
MSLANAKRRSALAIVLMLIVSALPVTPALAQDDPEQEWKDAYTAQYGSDPDLDALQYPAEVAAWRASWYGGSDAGQAWADAPECVGFIYVDNVGSFTGQQVLTGWAVDLIAEGATSGVDLVEVYFGEQLLGWDGGGYPRPEAVAYSGRPVLAGYEVPINFSALPTGQQPVSVWGRTACGWTEASVVLAIGPPAPPVAQQPPPVAPPPPPPPPSSTLSINDQRQTVAYSSGFSSGYSSSSTCVSRDIYGNCTQYSSSGYGTSCMAYDAYGNCTSYDSSYYGQTTGTEQNFDFTVTLSPASSQTVTVNYSTADGSAVQNEDYAGTSGTLTFSPGETSKIITVRVYGTTYGGEENFYVNLSNASGASIADNQGVGTIDRGSSSSVYGSGGYGGYYGGYGQQTCIQYDQYGRCIQYSSSGTVCIQYDSFGRCIQYSGQQTCIQYDSSGRCIQYSSSGTICIQYDSFGRCIQYGTGGSIAIGDGTCAASTTANTTCNFTVTQTGGSTSATVTYQTVNGQAQGTAACPATPVATQDFVAVSSSTVNVPASGTGTIAITICPRAAGDPNQTFGVNLISTTSGTISDANGTGTITVGAGTGGTIAINNQTCQSSASQTQCVFTVTQTGGTITANVTYNVGGGTATGGSNCATAGVDYLLPPPNSIVAMAPNNSNTISMTVCGSTAGESAETFNITLSGTNAAWTITDATGVGTIPATP